MNNFILTICTVGLPLGLVKYISENEVLGRTEKLNVLIKNTFVWFLILSLIFALIVIILSSYFSEILFSSPNYYYLLIIIALAFPFAAINSVFDAILRGLKRFKHYAKISIWLSFISTIISIVFAYFWNVPGVVLAVSTFSVLTGIIYIIFFSKTKFIDLKAIIKTPYKSTPEFKNIFKIGFVSLIGGFIAQFVLLAIRSLIIDKFSFDGSGLFQCMYSVSTNLFSFFFTALGVYSLPILSEIKGFEDNLNEMNNTFRFALYFILPAVCLTFVFREILLLILFSNNFTSASELFFFYLPGDFFKALAWVAGIWFIPNLKLKTWLFLEILVNVIYFLVFYFLTFNTNLGLKSVSLAYFVSNLIHFILCYYFFKKHSGFYFSNKNLKFLITSFLILIFTFFLSEYFSFYSQILIFPLLIVWLYFSTTNIERKKTLQLIKQKLN